MKLLIRSHATAATLLTSLLVSACSGGAESVAPNALLPGAGFSNPLGSLAAPKPSASPGPTQTLTAAALKPTAPPGPTQMPTAVPKPSQAALKFGAVLDANPLAPPGLSSIASLESALGRKLDYDTHYYWMTDAFPGPALVDDAANGRTPIVSLSCGGYTNADIAAGRHDVVIDKMANALKGYRQTVLVRYLWEMNSSIASNGRAACAGPNDTTQFDAADFIAAWDHLRARFTADGATNVKWYWCPNDSATTLPAYFPGVSQVDYVGVDLYDRTVGNYSAFSTHLQMTYASIEKLAPGAPFIVGETGAMSTDQVTYFHGLKALSATMPAIVAWTYFDTVGPLADWRIQPATPQFTAFRALVAP